MAEPSQVDMLMERLAEGDRAAFSPLFRALWPPTLSVCQRMLRTEADAADAAQTALMKILERAGEYDKHRPALPWALGIAAWECRTLLTRRQRMKETPGVPEAAEVRGLAEEVEQNLLVSAALHAMGELSPTDQDTLTATYWGSTTVGGATFRKRRERALTRLRKAFRRLYGFD